MTVTKIEAVPNSKNKYKIYVDEQFAFVLYKGELSRYKIKEDVEVSQELIEEIKNELVRIGEL